MATVRPPVVVLTGPLKHVDTSRVNTSTRVADVRSSHARTELPEAPPPRAHAPIPDDPGDELEQVAIFDSYGITHRSNTNGDLIITCLVPKTHKYSALPATDHPGKVLQVRVYVDPAHDLDDPEDDDMAGYDPYETR